MATEHGSTDPGSTPRGDHSNPANSNPANSHGGANAVGPTEPNAFTIMKERPSLDQLNGDAICRRSYRWIS
jgi:hypothetical protein